MTHFTQWAAGACIVALVPGVLAYAGDGSERWLLLLPSREQHGANGAETFRLKIQLTIPTEEVSAVIVTPGNWAPTTLRSDGSESEFEEQIEFVTLASMLSAANGTWTVHIEGRAESTTQFTLNTGGLGASSYFAYPVVTLPVPGTAVIPSNAEFAWTAPATGPFPATVVNPYIDLVGSNGQVQGGGPSDIFFGQDPLMWDPSECMQEPGARLALEYDKVFEGWRVGSYQVIAGAIDWNTPRLPLGEYPADAPIVACSTLTYRTYQVFRSADLNCDGRVDGADLGTLLGSWGTPNADLTGDGNTDGADLGTLLGNWTIG